MVPTNVRAHRIRPLLAILGSRYSYRLVILQLTCSGRSLAICVRDAVSAVLSRTNSRSESLLAAFCLSFGQLICFSTQLSEWREGFSRESANYNNGEMCLQTFPVLFPDLRVVTSTDPFYLHGVRRTFGFWLFLLLTSFGLAATLETFVK